MFADNLLKSRGISTGWASSNMDVIKKIKKRDSDAVEGHNEGVCSG